jgi:hypothetical protein
VGDVVTQSVGAVLTNLKAACDTIYASTLGPDSAKVLVSLGEPGQYQPAAIVAVGMAVRMPIEAGPMAPTRPREQTAEIDVVISVYVAGDESAQIIANAAALDMQAQLETYLRNGTNVTLGGSCRQALVVRAELLPSLARQTLDDPNMAPQITGRIADNVVTIEARIRY